MTGVNPRAGVGGATGDERSLVRAEWRGLAVYQPGQAIAEVDLTDNTSRFGVPPSALAVLQPTRQPRSRATRPPTART